MDSLTSWRPLTPSLSELCAICYLCAKWRPLGDVVEWHNVLALQVCYVCIDCLSEPLKEAGMRAYGWKRA